MAKKKFEQDHDVKRWWIFPYRWNLRSIFKDVWNPNEPRILPPKQFGVGWGINFCAIMKKLKSK